MMRVLLVVFATLGSSEGGNFTPYESMLPVGETSYCPTNLPESALRKHEIVPVCMFLEPLGKKAMFYVKVDDFGVLTATGEEWWMAGTANNTSTPLNKVWLAVDGKTTVGQNASFHWVNQAKTYMPNGYVTPFWTAIVQMSMGVVQRIVWDSGCYTCEVTSNECNPDLSPAKCPDRNGEAADCYDCAVNPNKCSTSTNCNPSVYLAWVGTDADGNKLTSAGMVISQFRKYSMQILYTSGKSSWDELGEVVQQ